MVTVKIKGQQINIIPVRASHYRRATLYKNNIFNLFKKIGLNQDYIELEVPTAAMQKLPASVSWYLDGQHLYYSYKNANNYAENLGVILKVLEIEINKLLNEQISIHDFIFEFTEEKDIEQERKKARELLNLHEDTTDMEEINKAYKKLAKSLHPDMPTGDINKFKELNKAHKVLRKELT